MRTAGAPAASCVKCTASCHDTPSSVDVCTTTSRVPPVAPTSDARTDTAVARSSSVFDSTPAVVEMLAPPVTAPTDVAVPAAAGDVSEKLQVERLMMILCDPTPGRGRCDDNGLALTVRV